MSANKLDSEPNRFVMASRFAVFILQVIVGLIAFVYTSSWILLSIWVGAFVVLYTVPRKFICARCESYGKKCRPFYFGWYTSKLFSYQKDESPPTWAALLEGLRIAATNILPFVPMILHFDLKGVPLLFAVYLALFLITFLALFFHACRYCVEHATEEWKKLCPANKLGQKLWG
jgi:hypothetical protein